MTTHDKLISVLTQEDDRLAKRESILNIYRIGHWLLALEDAELHPNGLADGLSESFTHSGLRDKLRKAAGLPTCDCGRANSCPLCS